MVWITKSRVDDALVLVSRSEVARGEWKRFQNKDFRLQPMGSVAYKLALVAADKADATWTLVPKNEWDVAAGVALLLVAKGHVRTSEGFVPSFNNRNTLFPGLVALSATGIERLRPFLEHTLTSAEFQDCVPWVQSLTSLGSEA